MEGRRQDLKKSFLARAWVFRFVSSGAKYAHVFKIKPMHVFLAVILIVFFSLGIVRLNAERIKMKEEKLTVLEDKSVKQEMIIERLKCEKKQIASLLEKQNNEMATKLEKIEKKSNEVRKIVGLKNEAQTPINKKRSLRGSRGGNVNLLRLHTDFKKISSELDSTAQGMVKLEKKAIAYRKEQERLAFMRMLESVPSMWPASGPIVSGYGMRLHPIYGYYRFHSGIDISALYGDPIYSSAYGTVTCSGYYSGYGNAVIIDHGNGITTLYGHCSSLLVREGETVRRGQLIARIGSTGLSTGPHLHYEVQIAGSTVNPEPYLDYTGARLAKMKREYGYN